VVGEFPELQGFMGARYAQLQGEDPSVVAAIEDHYKPQGPSDSVPTDPVAIAVALADKLDTLTGFWAIDEKPTGSKDPYALAPRGAGRDPDLCWRTGFGFRRNRLSLNAGTKSTDGIVVPFLSKRDNDLIQAQLEL
jgi:hypothetical protein